MTHIIAARIQGNSKRIPIIAIPESATLVFKVLIQSEKRLFTLDVWTINTRAPIVGTTEALYLRVQHASSKINAMMILITKRLKRFAILTEEIECWCIFNLPLSGLDGGTSRPFCYDFVPRD